MSMTTKEYMELSEEYVLHTYNRFPLVLEKGEGVDLYDMEGKKYMDFASEAYPQIIDALDDCIELIKKMT